MRSHSRRRSGLLSLVATWRPVQAGRSASRPRAAASASIRGRFILPLALLSALLGAGAAEAQFTHTQITSSTGGSNFAPSINSDGTRIAFESDRDLTGGNPDGNQEIFLWTSGSGFTQITSSTGGSNTSPSINSDGTRITFASNRDLTGSNADLNQEIFLWTSGSGLTQITSSTGGSNSEPSINSDGTRIAFRSNRDLTPGSPGNLDGNFEIFLWTSGVITQITNSIGGDNNRPSINSDGTRIAFDSNCDLTGGNADGNFEIFLWTSGSGFTQITSSIGGTNNQPSINSDGTRIAFTSNSDLTGGNADLNQEIFLWTSGSGLTQITNTTAGFNIEPSINSDGTRITFASNRDLTGGNADGNSEIFLTSSSAAIPTLSEWAQLAMVALLVGGGLWALRRRSLRLRPS